jgi:ABC-type molybdate transport system substrate-binding protein
VTPPNRNVYGALISTGQADVFLTYCTGAALATREDSSLAVVALPSNLAVGAEYGLATMNCASPSGAAFATFLLGPEGQRILAQAGFAPAIMAR